MVREMEEREAQTIKGQLRACGKAKVGGWSSGGSRCGSWAGSEA